MSKTIAQQFAALGLVDAACVPAFDDIARRKIEMECRAREKAHGKRVDSDAVARAKELRRFAAEAKRRHAAQAAPADPIAKAITEAEGSEGILLDAATYRAHAEEIAEHIFRLRPDLTVDAVLGIVRQEFLIRGYRKVEGQAAVAA